MASNRNIPQKGQGANDPEHNRQSVDTDAANVDWMIMSDLSTRIGGASQPKQPQQEAKNLSSTSAPQAANNQFIDDDLEDVEWLRSIGLDEPVEGSMSKRNTTSGSQDSNQNSNPVDDIDWLIVSDLKTRMDSPDRTDRDESGYQDIHSANVTPQAPLDLDGLDSFLDDDLGLDGLEFPQDSDFSELDSLDDLGFETSANLSSSELQDEMDITEGKILGLSEFLDDSLDSDNEVNNNWDEILEIAENNDSQFVPPSNLGIIEDSFEIPTQITGFVSNDEDYGENLDLISGQLSELISNEDIQEELLVNDLEISDELQVDNLLENIVEESAFESAPSDEFQDFLQESQDISMNEEVESINDLMEDFGDSLDDGFGEVQSLPASDVSAVEDAGFWGDVAILDSGASDDVFASDWQPLTTDTDHMIDDAIWDSANVAAEDLSSTSIDNVFGTFDDAAIASQTDAPQTEIFELEVGLEENLGFDLSSNDDDSDWSADLEAVIDAQTGDQSDWGLEPEIEFSNSDPDLEAEISHDLQSSVNLETELGNPEIDVSQDVDWSADLEIEIANSNSNMEFIEEQLTEIRTEEDDYNYPNWNAELGTEIDSIETQEDFQELEKLEEIVYDRDLLDVTESNLAEVLTAESVDENFDFSNNFDDDDFAIANAANNLNANNLIESFDDAELINPDSYQPYNPSTTNFETSENLLDQQSSDWESFSEAFSGQITDSDLDDDFANYVVKAVEPIPLENRVATTQNVSNPEDVADFEDLDSMIGDDFDLDSFDEDGFSEIPLSDTNDYIATTLTPSRGVAVPPPVDVSNVGITPPPSINPVNLVPPSNSVSNFLSDSLTDGLINDDYDLEVDLHEEALANDLLNGYTSDSDLVDNLVPEGESFSIPPLHVSSPISSPAPFAMDTIDRDFLDDFDLDSMDTQLTGGNLDSFTPAAISTGLTPPSPPPPPVPPISPSANQDITFPSVGNPPTPPPSPLFLPPLPPKRSHTNQPKPSSLSSSGSSSSGYQAPSRNRDGDKMREDDFDSFHSQQDLNKGRKPINPIDEGWSELLDADTVLSGVLRSPTGAPYSDPSSAMPPNGGTSAGSSARRASQGRDRNSSSIPKRRDTGLPDFNDLGLEIHDDNTDWSGLLDSGDLSDSITSISSSTQLPSRIRTTPLSSPRSEISGISETREIPRDRRKPMAGFDSTQARMAATPDQIDFNRFTEDNYESYGSPANPEPAPSPHKQPKLTMPSISLESLWQDYLKIPMIGLGAIGIAALLYSLLNRPIFDIGLRWGIFKDASGKDFTNADFKGAKLDNVDFSKATLTGAKMQDASLVGANFQEANLDGVNFTKANLNRARLIKASVVWAEFNNAQMNLVDLAGADLTLSNFANAKMEGTNLKDAKIGTQGTDKATKFNSKILLAWQIVNQPLEGRNLADQDLSGLNLSFTSLKRANLLNSKLNYTDLTSTDLRGANLTGSQVNGANWSAAKLAGINLTNVVFDKTKLPKTDEETICPNGKKGPCQF